MKWRNVHDWEPQSTCRISGGCNTAVEWLNTQQEVVDPLGAKPERPKLEPEGPRAEVVFPSADQGFSSIEGTVFGFVAFK